MKKILLILFCTIFPFIFIACSNQYENKEELLNSKVQSQSDNTIISPTNQDNSKTNEEKLSSNSLNAETIILTMFNQENESLCDEETEKFLNDIKSCKDTPNVVLINKVGSISIKYKKSDEKAEYAALYLASDNNVYAKYTAEGQNDYAYKIDIEKLNH